MSRGKTGAATRIRRTLERIARWIGGAAGPGDEPALPDHGQRAGPSNRNGADHDRDRSARLGFAAVGRGLGVCLAAPAGARRLGSLPRVVRARLVDHRPAGAARGARHGVRDAARAGRPAGLARRPGNGGGAGQDPARVAPSGACLAAGHRHAGARRCAPLLRQRRRHELVPGRARHVERRGARARARAGLASGRRLAGGHARRRKRASALRTRGAARTRAAGLARLAGARHRAPGRRRHPATRRHRADRAARRRRLPGGRRGGARCTDVARPRRRLARARRRAARPSLRRLRAARRRRLADGARGARHAGRRRRLTARVAAVGPSARWRRRDARRRAALGARRADGAWPADPVQRPLRLLSRGLPPRRGVAVRQLARLGRLARGRPAGRSERVRSGVLATLERLGRAPELYAVTRAGELQPIAVANRVQAWTVGARWALTHGWTGRR